MQAPAGTTNVLAYDVVSLASQLAYISRSRRGSLDFARYVTFLTSLLLNSRTHVVSGSCSDVFVYGKSKYDVILPIPCSTKEENSDW